MKKSRTEEIQPEMKTYRIEVLETGEGYVTRESHQASRWCGSYSPNKVETVILSIESKSDVIDIALNILKSLKSQSDAVELLRRKISSFNAAQENLKV